MTVEVELKFLLPVNEAPELLFSQLVGRIGKAWQAKSAQRLLNAYFDTTDHWFRRHDSGLRTRQRLQQFEQTIKLAGQSQGAAHIRPEYNLPCAGVTPELTAFPAEIWPIDTDVAALQKQLVELFRTDFNRQAFWVNTGQSQLELVCDIGVVSAGGRQEPIAEIELELISGNLNDILALARQLLQDTPLLLGVQSKAERGYRLAQAQPLVMQPWQADFSLSQALRGYLVNQILASRGELSAIALEDYWCRWQSALQAQAHPLVLQMVAARAPRQRQLFLLDCTAALLGSTTSV